MADWFELSETDVLDGLGTGRQGIGEDEAEKRLGTYGENVLQENGKLQWWQVFLSQFKDLLVIILIAAAAVSMLTGSFVNFAINSFHTYSHSLGQVAWAFVSVSVKCSMGTWSSVSNI